MSRVGETGHLVHILIGDGRDGGNSLSYWVERLKARALGTMVVAVYRYKKEVHLLRELEARYILYPVNLAELHPEIYVSEISFQCSASPFSFLETCTLCHGCFRN